MFDTVFKYIYELAIPYFEYYRVVFFVNAKILLKDLDKLLDEYGGFSSD
jgi:hypothetical protein